MNLQIDKLKFGDPDAFHEWVKQSKDSSRVLMNSFVAPPKANISQLETGAKFLIVGPKGTGKTTVLLHLRDQKQDEKSSLILFKSHLRNEDRARLDKLTQTIVVQDQGKYSIDSDYKTVWEWYILKNVFRLLQSDDILEGKEYFKDIVMLLEADKRKFNTLFDTMHVEGAKGNVKLTFDIGALKSEIGAEIESRRKNNDEIDLLDLVRLTQHSLKNIRLKKDISCRLYIDELEFFLEDAGNGERDRRMVRDLVFSVYNMNMIFQESHFDALIYACVRSEVINSFPGSSLELSKIIKSFSVSINWEPPAGQESAVLDIFSRKIVNSEIEETGYHCDDPWRSYFPSTVEGKDIKRFLLDMGTHRPRGVLLCIIAAAERAWGRDHFIESDFDDHDNVFAQSMLDEFKDEMSASMFDYEIEASIALLRGKRYVFDLSDMKSRLHDLSSLSSVQKMKKRRDVDFIIKTLYRCGIIGNFFRAEENQLQRQTWAIRGYPEPIMDKPFIVHQSLQRLLDMV